MTFSVCIHLSLWHPPPSLNIQSIHLPVSFNTTNVGADPGTLQILSELLGELPESARPQYLLLIGAYRDNEVNKGHPLVQVIKDLTIKGGWVEDLALVPLQLAHVKLLVEDTFSTITGMFWSLASFLVHNDIFLFLHRCQDLRK